MDDEIQKLPKMQKNPLKKLGPAFISAAVILGPGSIFLCVMSGALFAYKMLFIIILASLFKAVYVELYTRIGVMTPGKTIWDLVREKYGKGLALACGIIAFLIHIGYQTGSITASGLAFNAILGGPPLLWNTLILIASIVFVMLKGLYKKTERFMMVLVLLMMVTFVGTLCITGFDLKEAARGALPSMLPNQRAWFMAIGLTGTVLGLNNAVFQSYAVKNKGYRVEDLGYARFDSYFGLIVVFVVSAVILFTSAKTLHMAGVVPKNVADMALQLEPLAGALSKYLFSLGIIAAAFSSIVASSLIGGVLMADGMGKYKSTDDKLVKELTIVILVVGYLFSCIPTLLNVSAIDTVIVAQAFSIVGMPVYGFVAIKFTNDKSVVGPYRNGRVRNVIAALGYAMILCVAVYYVIQLIT